jgi:hypothetical protein
VAASRRALAVRVVTWDLGGQDAVMRLSPLGGLEPWKKSAAAPAPKVWPTRQPEYARTQARLEAADGAEPDGPRIR